MNDRAPEQDAKEQAPSENPAGKLVDRPNLIGNPQMNPESSASSSMGDSNADDKNAPGRTDQPVVTSHAVENAESQQGTRDTKTGGESPGQRKGSTDSFFHRTDSDQEGTGSPDQGSGGYFRQALGLSKASDQPAGNLRKSFGLPEGPEKPTQVNPRDPFLREDQRSLNNESKTGSDELKMQKTDRPDVTGKGRRTGDAVKGTHSNADSEQGGEPSKRTDRPDVTGGKGSSQEAKHNPDKAADKHAGMHSDGNSDTGLEKAIESTQEEIDETGAKMLEYSARALEIADKAPLIANLGEFGEILESPGLGILGSVAGILAQFWSSGLEMEKRRRVGEQSGIQAGLAAAQEIAFQNPGQQHFDANELDSYINKHYWLNRLYKETPQMGYDNAGRNFDIYNPKTNEGYLQGLEISAQALNVYIPTFDANYHRQLEKAGLGEEQVEEHYQKNIGAVNSQAIEQLRKHISEKIKK